LKEKLNSFEKEIKFFEMLVDGLPGIFYIFDKNINMVKWNKNLEKVTGYSGREVVELTIPDVIAGDDLERVQKTVEDMFETGFGSTEALLVTKDGTRIPYFFSGITTVIEEKAYFMGVGLDISKRKQAEDELRESEALYRMFAERMTEGVMIFSNFKIIFANDVFMSMFGYTDQKQILGTDVMDLVADGFQMHFKEMYDFLQKGMNNERSFQARWVTREGREIWVEGCGNSIQWKGEPTVLLTARDITEIKQKEISMQEEADNLRRENIKLRSSIKDRYRFGEIIGKSAAMQKIYEQILNAAATNANVVIYGESGTGKELVARAVHETSKRSGKMFVPVNSSAIPENLLESEFFGHTKGAFTGAHSDKQGYLDLADGGTLFLDEIGELIPSLQAKLLRALEGGGYTPVGGSLPKGSDFRIISATNKNLRELTQNGKIREDFFYRIHIIPIYMPPLRYRKDDIPLLVEHFLGLYSSENNILTIPGQVLETLINYNWPGNVRELQNVLQRYFAVKHLDFLEPANGRTGVFNKAEIQKEFTPAYGPGLQESIGMPEKSSAFSNTSKDQNNDLAQLDEAISTHIRRALELAKGKIEGPGGAAERLGINPSTLRNKMKKLGVLYGWEKRNSHP